MARIHILNDPSGRIIVSFPYDPLLVSKVKTIEGRRWHSVEKHWSFLKLDGMLEKILKVFGNEEIQIDPALKGIVPDFVVSAQSNDLRTERSGVVESGLSPKFDFEDLRKELVSRKYSYKTIKGYLYYNKDFINHVQKNPSEIKDEDIKNYLVYLSETKGAATSTLNQAINALKFYYGAIHKKKFIYEVRRPRKDKKLPVVLSKEEVSKILTSVDNLKHKAILMLVYSAGLRVGEVVKLKTEDIDSNRMLIHIKGAKRQEGQIYLTFRKSLGNPETILEKIQTRKMAIRWGKGGPIPFIKDSRQDIQKCLRQSRDKEGCFIACSSAQFRHAPFGGRNRSQIYSRTLRSLP
jgi:integrase/recombinase XerD